MTQCCWALVFFLLFFGVCVCVCVLQLRAMGRGFTSATNPYLATRRRFQKLYNDFAPQHHYWRLLLLMRKLALVCASVLANSYLLFQVSRCALRLYIGRRSSVVCRATVCCAVSAPATAPLTVWMHPCQASVSISVLFAAYVLHARFRPFLPRASVNKAFMNSQAFRNALVTMAPQGLSADELDTWIDTEVERAKKRLSYTFDYNSLEAGCLSALRS